ncbi:YceI family protein [Luteimonas soli]|uniref:YceI family protein n=1 Tax=Luteimonas soli TaxID=1648966 RepID=A0ABV7XLG9_9GAMM
MRPSTATPARLTTPSPHGAGACAALLLAALAWPGAAFAEAARYALDPVHTRVMFELSHAGYSQAIGTVSGSTGTLVFDPDDWSVARVDVSVPLLRLDLGDAKWNRAALGRNLLDGNDHPAATFVSTRVEGIDGTHASVFGTLTLRGVSREVKLDVVFNQLERYPLPPFARTVGFSATTTISREAFGIDAWPGVIGDAVALRIEAEARRVRGGDVVEEAEASDPPSGEAPREKPAPAAPATDETTPEDTPATTQDPTP